MGRQIRQRPVSCKLCRQRKLRCSRIFPCSNCTCRGVVCEHDGPTASSSPQVPRSVAFRLHGDARNGADTGTRSSTSPDVGADASTSTGINTSFDRPRVTGDVPNAQLLARLERLEALITAQVKESSQAKPRPAPSFPEETPAAQPTTDVVSPVPPQLQKLTDDALLIESSSYTGQPMIEPLYDPIYFRTCPARRIFKQGGFVLQQNDPTVAGEVSRCIWLPLRDEARIVMQKFTSDVNHFHHVVHVPTLPGIIDPVYDALDRNETPGIGSVSLLLAMCAAATYTWTHRDDSRLLFESVDEAIAHFPLWVKAALDATDHAQRIGHASLEYIQSMFIMYYIFCSSEGLTSRCRGLISRSIFVARDMAIHKVDLPSNRDAPKMGSLQLEMYRRMWWFLVSTEWMITQFAYPHERSFSIVSSHVSVRKPSNVNDVDIEDSQPVIGRPLNEPTDSSGLIYRVRLAELWQTMLEKQHSSIYHSETLDYKTVMERDGKLRGFLQELPDFLSIDSTAMSSLPSMHPRHNPRFTLQRYTINVLIHLYLCRLHLPYLVRGSVESAYAYSHQSCLTAARMIINVERHLKSENLPFSCTRLRSIIVRYSAFLASIAFVLDACTGRESEDSSVNNSHLVEAWRIMDETKYDSYPGFKLLDLSLQILRRHSPNHPALEMFSSLPIAVPATTDSAENQRRNMLQGFLSRPDTGQIPQEWQAMEGPLDFSTLDFDRLFHGLEAPFI